MARATLTDGPRSRQEGRASAARCSAPATPNTPRPYPHRMTCSDPALIAAFRKQAENMGADLALLLWRGRPGTHDEDLLDVVKELDAERAKAAKQLPA